MKKENVRGNFEKKTVASLGINKNVKKTPKLVNSVLKSEKKIVGTKKIIRRPASSASTPTNAKAPSKNLKSGSKKERVSSGISGFDKMIEGGFVVNSINLVSGETGTGKSIFAIQYLLNGLKNGETVLYVTFEEKKDEFYKNMLKIGWDLAKYEKAEKFIFLEYSPEKVRMMLDEGGGSIEALVLKYKVKRLVLDSVTSFSLLFDDEHERRAAISGIFDIIEKWDCTTLLTVQSDSTKLSVKTKSLRAEVDSITLLYWDRIKNDRKRLVEVIKMRRTKHSTRRHLFEIARDGIKVR